MTTTDTGTEISIGRLTSEAYKHAQDTLQTSSLIRLMVDAAARLGNGTEAAKAELLALLTLAEGMADQDYVKAITIARRLEDKARKNPGS